MDATSARMTQRAPRACTRCATKKRACSKTVPCAACTRDGLAHSCHREMVVVRKHARPAKARHLSRRHSKDEGISPHRRRFPDSAGANSSAEQQATAAVLVDLSQQSGHRGTPVNTLPTPRSSGQLEDLKKHNQWPWTLPELEMPSSPQQEDACPFESMLTSLEVLVWGRQRDAQWPPVTRPMPALHGSAHEDILSPQQAIQVLKFHWKWLACFHNILQWEKLREECTTYWNSGRVKEKAWIALYNAVLCVSKQCK